MAGRPRRRARLNTEGSFAGTGSGRWNPADLQGRYAALQRMAAPDSGAFENERSMALREMRKIEQLLGMTPFASPPLVSLQEVLRLHTLWLAGQKDGVRANLFRAILVGVVLARVNLCRANLSMADLRGADLRWANLQGANLEGANLQGANLEEANLEEANLEGANIQSANLEKAKFSWTTISSGPKRR